MRKLTFLAIYLALTGMIAACGSSMYSNRSADRPAQSNVVNIENDQEEHNLIILDPGYNQWAVTNAKPIQYYSPQYYRQWNQRYVQAWNALANQALRYGSNFPFENQIDYDYTTDYGVELDYELFTYFQYVAARYSSRYDFPRPVAGYIGT